jgi:hypothetical protein
MTHLDLLSNLLENSVQLETSNGRLIVYIDKGDTGEYKILATYNETRAQQCPSVEGTVAGWSHPGFQNGTYDPAEGWFVQSTPEGSIVTVSSGPNYI